MGCRFNYKANPRRWAFFKPLELDVSLVTQHLTSEFDLSQTLQQVVGCIRCDGQAAVALDTKWNPEYFWNSTKGGDQEKHRWFARLFEARRRPAWFESNEPWPSSRHFTRNSWIEGKSVHVCWILRQQKTHCRRRQKWRKIDWMGERFGT